MWFGSPQAIYIVCYFEEYKFWESDTNLKRLANDDYRALSLSGHVGFSSLPDQLVKKSISRGFCFNILCVGETGSGKSTLINSLFNATFDDPVSTHFLPEVKLRAQTYELQESNILLKLTIVNTVGFGDQIDKEDSYQPVVDYIDAQFDAYLQEELKIKRSLFSYHDTRIHVCLYFISPAGHSLKSLDLLTMRRLDSKVNIIPIIGKADSITKSELQNFKNKIMFELVSNGIQIYQFPTDDETVSKINAIMNGHMPFAVVGSNEKMQIGNKMVRVRQYPWGIVQVENENHCDFVKLRQMLICTNMEDLREQTHARHYELYRRCRLEEMAFRGIGPGNEPASPQEAYEAERSEFYLELQRKEKELRQQFVQRKREKAAKLKEEQQQLLAKYERQMQMLKEMDLKLEKKKKVLEDEIAMFLEKKANAELLQSQASISAPPVSLKEGKDHKKNQGFRLELLCFDIRDEEIVTVHEQSKREREKLERERNSPRGFPK
ncbi:PREDICTED: septin-11-like [Nestor notabilis]|uniref:septin-11-like n=1 Tax=Nestor notabilis TaxID=176057 RepID=UPI0005231C0B|nr:PREDICTED: septin-11-like [Nestor notabilis]